MLGRKAKKSGNTNTDLSASASETHSAGTGFTGMSHAEMASWSVKDVTTWLVTMGMGAYSKDFASNEISGAELIDLQADDLAELGVKKLGHKKKLMRMIQGVYTGDSTSQSQSNLELSSSYNARSELGSSSSDTGVWNVKVTYNDATRRVKIPHGARLVDLKSEIISRFKIKSDSIRIRYMDEDGDKVSLSSEDDWQDCQTTAGSVIRIYVSSRSKSRSSKSSASSSSRRRGKREKTTTDSSLLKHFAMYQSLLSPIIVINKEGVIQFMNSRVTKLTGYKNLVGKNVKVLMPPEHAQRHDQYLKNYLETGEAKVIGLGRNVVVMTMDGMFKPVHLSVTETSVKGQKMFVGVFGESKEDSDRHSSMLSTVRDILDSLSNPAIAITSSCVIQVFNKAAQDLFGYSTVEVMGKNVKMLMPENHAKEHDNYIKRYLDTGEAKILGVGRDVVLLKKNGELARMFLTVTERQDRKNHIFTGVFQPSKDE